MGNNVINHKIREALKSNWGEKADAMNCYAEVKLIDPLSSWCCYLYAMDKDEEEVKCIFYSDAMGVEIDTMRLNDLMEMYNEEGENVMIDPEFRRISVYHLLRRLRNDA